MFLSATNARTSSMTSNVRSLLARSDFAVWGSIIGCIILADRNPQKFTGAGMTVAPNEVTQLLIAWGNGDAAARDELMSLVYAELHRLARQHMRRERAGNTLQTSALVNEAYLRLVDQKNVH